MSLRRFVSCSSSVTFSRGRSLDVGKDDAHLELSDETFE